MTEPARPAAARRRRWIWSVAILGVLLHLPSLGGGFSTDDHLHQLALEGKLPMRPWALYDFGTAEDWAHVPSSLPWWTSPDWKVRFFRPLSSLSLALDHSLFGANAAAHHAVSLACLLALLLVSYALGRVLGLARTVAAGAAALLAASGATVYPTDWLANRNSLLAAGFTVAAVAALASHPRLGRTRALVLSLGCAVLACLSKESGVVAFGAIAAYTVVFRDALQARWARRVATAAVVCAIVYAAALAAAGYGTRSGFYATPWSDLGRYASNLGTLVTVGALALLTPVPSDFAFFLPATIPVLAVAGSVLVIVVGSWARRRLRGERAAVFLAVWGAMSLLPEAAAPPQDRLLLAATVPVSMLLAMLVARTLPAGASGARWERLAAGALVVLAGVEALATVLQSAASAVAVGEIRSKVLAVDAGPAALGRREVVVLQVDDPLVAFSMPSTWAFYTHALGVRFTPLQTGRRALRWTRIDDRTVEFESLGQPLVTNPFELVYRASRDAPSAGTVADLNGIRVEVVATDPAGGVRTVRMSFEDSLDAERIRFVTPRDGRLLRIPPPRSGESDTLAEVPRANPLVP